MWTQNTIRKLWVWSLSPLKWISWISLGTFMGWRPWPGLTDELECHGLVMACTFSQTLLLWWAHYNVNICENLFSVLGSVQTGETTFCFCCASQFNTANCIFSPFWAVHPCVLCVCVLLEACKAFLYTRVIMFSMTIFTAFGRWTSQLCNAPDKSFSSVVKFRLLDFRKKNCFAMYRTSGAMKLRVENDATHPPCLQWHIDANALESPPLLPSCLWKYCSPPVPGTVSINNK